MRQCEYLLTSNFPVPGCIVIENVKSSVMFVALRNFMFLNIIPFEKSKSFSICNRMFHTANKYPVAGKRHRPETETRSKLRKTALFSLCATITFKF